MWRDCLDVISKDAPCLPLPCTATLCVTAKKTTPQRPSLPVKSWLCFVPLPQNCTFPASTLPDVGKGGVATCKKENSISRCMCANLCVCVQMGTKIIHGDFQIFFDTVHLWCFSCLTVLSWPCSLNFQPLTLLYLCV